MVSPNNTYYTKIHYLLSLFNVNDSHKVLCSLMSAILTALLFVSFSGCRSAGFPPNASACVTVYENEDLRIDVCIVVQQKKEKQDGVASGR